MANNDPPEWEPRGKKFKRRPTYRRIAASGPMIKASSPPTLRSMSRSGICVVQQNFTPASPLNTRNLRTVETEGREMLDDDKLRRWADLEMIAELHRLHNVDCVQLDVWMGTPPRRLDAAHLLPRLLMLAERALKETERSE